MTDKEIRNLDKRLNQEIGKNEILKKEIDKNCIVYQFYQYCNGKQNISIYIHQKTYLYNELTCYVYNNEISHSYDYKFNCIDSFIIFIKQILNIYNMNTEQIKSENSSEVILDSTLNSVNPVETLLDNTLEVNTIQKVQQELELSQEIKNNLSEQIGSEPGEKKAVYLDKIAFEGKENMIILYKLIKYSEELWFKKEQWIDTIMPRRNPILNVDFREIARNYLDVVPPITAEEIINISNAEIKRICIKYFGWENLLSHFKHEIIDSVTLERDNLRWDDELLQRIDRIQDKYELINVEYPIKTRSGDTETIKFQLVRCWCTTTNREYVLNAIPPNIIKRERVETYVTTDVYTSAIEAICSTMQIDVKEEAIKHWYRHGDVLFVDFKDEYKKDFDKEENLWKCDKRVITVDEYLNKLIAQA
jgi:hypothetical protein